MHVRHPQTQKDTIMRDKEKLKLKLKSYEPYITRNRSAQKLVRWHLILTPNVELRETTSVLLIPFTVVRQSVS